MSLLKLVFLDLVTLKYVQTAFEYLQRGRLLLVWFFYYLDYFKEQIEDVLLS